MPNVPLMQAYEPIAGNLAEAYILRDGKRSLLMRLKEFEGKTEVKNIEVPRMGTTMNANRMGQMTGKWDATLYYGSPIFKEILLEYKRTGKILYFDIMTINNDPNSNAGSQTTVYKNCKIDGAILSKMNISADMLDEKVSGTYDDFDIPEMFQYLEGEK